LRKRTHIVAVIRPIWIAENHCTSEPFNLIAQKVP
jgi:hypothetical protein